MVGKRVANKGAAKPTLRDQADQHRRAGHFARALEVYEAHLREQPDDYQALLDQGSVLMSLERFADAAQVYSKMVQIKPNETVLSNLGAALIRLGRANEAKVVLDYALEINPKNINARINLGGVLQALGMHQENLKNALEAVSIDPTQPLAFNNLGSALFDLAKFPEAKHAFETAILLDSKNVDAQINIANIESKLGSPQASIEAYKKALSLLPTEAKQRAEAIRFYMSFEYLKQGILPEGWDCYEGGFSNLVPVAGARHPRRNFSVPRWNGELLNGKTLLVWREQGLGDELLFATCLHELEALGGKIIVECDRRLVETFTRSFPQYTVRVEAFLPEQAMQSPYRDFDLHVPLGSLMKYFRRDIKDFERSGAYIRTDPAKVAKFAERLASYKEDYRLVGICWRSGKLDPVRNLGYTALDEWGEVLQTPGFKFVNLQYGECEVELREAEEKYGVEILRWPDLNLKDDLDDVFALMQCLDAVASVQTAVLVMGGSVGSHTTGFKVGGWTTFGLRNRFPILPDVSTTESFNELSDVITSLVLSNHDRGKLELTLLGFSDDSTRLPDLVKPKLALLMHECEHLLRLSTLTPRANLEAGLRMTTVLERAYSQTEESLVEKIEIDEISLNKPGLEVNWDLVAHLCLIAAKNADWRLSTAALKLLERHYKLGAERIATDLAWVNFLAGNIKQAEQLALQARLDVSEGMAKCDRKRARLVRMLVYTKNLEMAIELAGNVDRKGSNTLVHSELSGSLIARKEWEKANDIFMRLGNLVNIGDIVNERICNFKLYGLKSLFEVSAHSPYSPEALKGKGFFSMLAMRLLNDIGLEVATELVRLDSNYESPAFRRSENIINIFRGVKSSTPLTRLKEGSEYNLLDSVIEADTFMVENATGRSVRGAESKSDVKLSSSAKHIITLYPGFANSDNLFARRTVDRFYRTQDAYWMNGMLGLAVERPAISLEVMSEYYSEDQQRLRLDSSDWVSFLYETKRDRLS
jgi:tetratricopeptide (TPR) repeat protein